ncbi:hypothetical protein BB561_001733 [Smittium simulii]|uniref:Uncharacterized protein n=1 Tax=Smittium simulii TaxID=133385 RepID=A0A2T9YTA0_9FUNG|nr:hypothetical protein BB561_001733 [Smittium simulii]
MTTHSFKLDIPSQEEIKAKTDDMSARYLNKYIEDDDPLIRENYNISLKGIDQKNIVNKNKLPEPYRLIYPLAPVTLDLRLDRLNLYIDNTGKVTNISYH